MSTMTLKPELTGTYVLDPSHSRLGFVARHAMVTKVRGRFNEFHGTMHLDFNDPTKSTVQVTIAVDSVDTGNEERDADLRTNNFLDAPSFPHTTFVSTAVENVDDLTYRLAGDLTIRGVTKPVTVEFTYGGAATDASGVQRVGFEGTATINRKDFGVTFNALLETGGVLISEEITLEFDISAIKAPAAT